MYDMCRQVKTSKVGKTRNSCNTSETCKTSETSKTSKPVKNRWRGYTFFGGVYHNPAAFLRPKY